MSECEKRQSLPRVPKQGLVRPAFQSMAGILACVMLGCTALAQVTVQTWNGQFNDTRNNTNYPFVMAGTDPSNQNQKREPYPGLRSSLEGYFWELELHVGPACL